MKSLKIIAVLILLSLLMAHVTEGRDPVPGSVHRLHFDDLGKAVSQDSAEEVAIWVCERHVKNEHPKSYLIRNSVQYRTDTLSGSLIPEFPRPYQIHVTAFAVMKSSGNDFAGYRVWCDISVGQHNYQVTDSGIKFMMGIEQ